MGDSLMTTAESDGVFPHLDEWQRVALFMTTVLFIGEVSTLLAYLDLPVQIKFKRLRTAKRVIVTQPILINNID